MEYVEVEQKYALPETDRLVARLMEIGATRHADIRQVDSYYNAPHRDFLAPESVSEWLRIRDEGGHGSLNYKRWHPLDAVVKTHCDEYETPIADLEALRRTLRALDFAPIVVVDKVRQEWRVGDEVIVAVDTVAGLGSFVEFEFHGDAATVGEAIERLAKHIADLGVPLGDRLNLGYPHLLLGRQH
jgi:adenylate cyclase, class 2